MSGKYNIHKPHLYNKDWRIFPNTILSNLELDDCNDTVNGFCENTDTLKQCIDICKNDPLKLCDGGYFIEASDRNYCVPLSSTTSEPSYHYYRFRNTSAYPQLKNVKTTSFISTKYDFPPNMVNRLFYMDNIVIKNVKTGLQISQNLNNALSNEIFLSNNNSINIQLIPKIALQTNIKRYMPVFNGDTVAINIPYTGLILENTNNGLKWLMRYNNKLFSENSFKIFSTDTNKAIGDSLNYTDTFYFLSSDNMILSVQNNTLQVVTQNNSQNTDFQLIPNIKVYYCDKNKCQTINLQNTDMNGDNATFKNSRVYRMPGCWNRCNKKEKLYIWILAVLIIVVLILFIKLFLKK